MAIQALFPTLVSRVRIGFDRALADECQAPAASGAAGRRWSALHYPGGYTSYGSLHYDLLGLRLDMTDCGLYVMPAGTVHSGHLHPTSFISSAYYVAAPPRCAAAPQRFRSFVSVRAASGDLILFESWLRHEVPAARFAGERVSISFNYGWEKKRR
jgi:hypothetical protein